MYGKIEETMKTATHSLYSKGVLIQTREREKKGVLKAWERWN